MASSSSSPQQGRPTRLKDFLEDDIRSDYLNEAVGFRNADPPGGLAGQTMRYLLSMELGDGNRGETRLSRRRSKGVLMKLSLVINAAKMIPFEAPSPTGREKTLQKQGGGGGAGALSWSLSRKLRKGFWRRWEKGENRDQSSAVRTATLRVRDIVRLRSFNEERCLPETVDKAAPPSPLGSTHGGASSSSSSCCDGPGAWSDTDSTSTGCDSFSCRTSECCGDAKVRSPTVATVPSTPYEVIGVGEGEDSLAKSPCCREPEAGEEEEGGGGGGGKRTAGCLCHFEEEKDQLSPVSVMDFPFEEDDEDGADGPDGAGAASAAVPTAAPSSPFHRGVANLEKTKLLQKMRELETLAEPGVAADLDHRFASAEDDAEPDRGIRGMADRTVQLQGAVEERAYALLEELKRRGRAAAASSPRNAPVAAGGCVDELLLDFFVEQLASCVRHNNLDVYITMNRRGDRTPAEEEEAVLRAAEDWARGRREAEAHGWLPELTETEVDGRWRWPRPEDKEEIAADLGGAILESLVDGLVPDLFPNRRLHLP